MGEAGRSGLVTVSGLSFHCGNIEPALVELTSPPLASHIFFKLRGMCFRAPRCCPWEPNNYGTVRRMLWRGQASGAQQGSWEGWGLLTSVLGPEMSSVVRPIPASERSSVEVGISQLMKCVSKGTLELARGRGDMLVTKEMDPALSRLFPVWGL